MDAQDAQDQDGRLLHETLTPAIPAHTGHIVMGSARNQQPIFGFWGRLEERPAQAGFPTVFRDR